MKRLAFISLVFISSNLIASSMIDYVLFKNIGKHVGKNMDRTACSLEISQKSSGAFVVKTELDDKHIFNLNIGVEVEDVFVV